MDILGALTRIRDPLGELPTEEERRQRSRYGALRQKVRTLESAQRTVGGVGPDLKQAEHELAAVAEGLPRGHTRGFVALCVWFAGTLAPLVVASVHMQIILVEMWQSPDHWYLQRHRPLAAGVWRLWQAMTSSLWAVLVPVVVLALIWAGQRKLPRWRSRTMITTAAAIETAFVLVMACVLGRLLGGPL
jgi:hypothetical protein